MSRGKCRLKFKQLFPSMLLSDWGEREREREKEITIKIFMKWVEGNVALNLNNYSLLCFSAIGREREREREREITIKIFMKWVEGNVALNLNNYSLLCFSAIGERERERKKLQLKSSWNESREMSP